MSPLLVCKTILDRFFSRLDAIVVFTRQKILARIVEVRAKPRKRDQEKNQKPAFAAQTALAHKMHAHVYPIEGVAATHHATPPVRRNTCTPAQYVHALAHARTIHPVFLSTGAGRKMVLFVSSLFPQFPRCSCQK